jgi:Spy/CpxP family protein refolding chaperone
MNVENKNIWQIRLATISIFLLGFIAGGFAFNAYYIWSGASSKHQTKQERYEEAFSRLELSPAQKSEVQTIVKELRGNIQNLRQESEPKLQEIRFKNDERLKKVLTSEQWNKFQELRENIRTQEEDR